jgi:crossover junction endodeoxyribonuclease RuvC
MIVLGVDPGTLATGWGVIVVEPRRPLAHRAHGVIRTRAEEPLWERLLTIDRALAEVIAEHRPDALALEQCFVAKNVQSALKLGHTRGVIMVAARRAGAEVHEYTPGQVKSAVTGHGRAEKHQVAEMVRVILGLAAAAASDASDALAAAICHGHGQSARALLSAASGAPK